MEVKERREFSIQGGMCARCEGVGKVSDFDLTAYDASKSLREGALTIRAIRWTGGTAGSISAADSSTPTSRSRDSPRTRTCSTSESTRIKVDGINVTYEGLIPKIQKSMLSRTGAMQPHIRAFVDRAVVFQTCP